MAVAAVSSQGIRPSNVHWGLGVVYLDVAKYDVLKCRGCLPAALDIFAKIRSEVQQ